MATPASNRAILGPIGGSTRLHLRQAGAGLSSLLLILIMSACNRPASEPPPNLLATSVSETLTAQPAFVPSSTFLPLLVGSSPTPTETPTPEPSGTQASSTTPSAIPLAPDDPRLGLNLSAPDVQDDFSQPLWFVGSDDATASFAYENNRFRVSDNLADQFVWWSTTTRQASDLYAEVTGVVGTCSGKDGYGMGIRVGGENRDQAYTLEISCDGSYRLRKFISGEVPLTLMNWAPSERIQSGPEATNRIGLFANGDQLYAFANGELLSTQPIKDDGYSSGIFSLFASASQTPGLTVFFDDFALWFLSP